MERLSKFTIYLGIGMGVTVFILLMISILPFILEQSMNQWERLDRNPSSKEELRAMLVEHPSYAAMYERYPDAKEEFTYHAGNHGSLSVGVMNFDTNNKLRLNLNYDEYNDSVNAYARCDSDTDRHVSSADGLFVEDYIRNTKCIEWTDSGD